MRKQEFLAELQREMAGLPQSEVEERVIFYSEMIDDKVEEGLTEEEAVAGIGPVKDIVAQAVSEIPFTKLVKEKVKPDHSLKAWEIVLLVLGSPIWLSLLIAAFAVIFSVYIVGWAVIISLWAVWFSLLAAAIGGIAASILLFAQGHVFPGCAMFGACLICAGLSVFLFFGCKEASKGILWLTKRMALGLKSMFVRKENEK